MVAESNKENTKAKKKMSSGSNTSSSDTGKSSKKRSKKNNNTSPSNKPNETESKKVKRKMFLNSEYGNRKSKKAKAPNDMSSPAPGPNPYPNLVPTKGVGFNLSKKLLTQIYLKELSHSIYHVWLNCLWNSKVTYNDIIQELQPIFGQNQRPQERDIFIVGQALSNGLIEPIGSCFILIDQKVWRNKGQQEFNMRIAANKLKMIEVNIAMLRNHVKTLDTLIFSRVHKQALDTFPMKMILKACGMDEPVPPAIQPQVKIIPRASTSTAKVKETTTKQQDTANATESKQPARKKSSPDPKSKGSTRVGSLSPTAEDNQPARRKSNRIAAMLDGPRTSKSDEPQAPVDYAALEAMLTAKVEIDSRKVEVVNKLLPQLKQFGEIVIKIDNLPSKLTVYAFNLMMGSWSIKPEQMVAADIGADKNGRPLMSLRLIMRANDPDAERILSKDKSKTAYDTILHIQKTSYSELERFILKNHDKIRKLELDDMLPTNNISFASPKPLLDFNHLPKWAAGYALS